MTERFLTKAQAAEILGLAPRRVYEMMRSGVIESWCINPNSKHKQYLTTMNALGKWQAAVMVRPQKQKKMKWNGDEHEGMEIGPNGQWRFKRK